MNHLVTRKIRTRQSLIHKLAGTILLLLFFTAAFSQTVSDIFISDEPFTPQKSGNLSVAVDNLNFFKNNEYKSNYVEGYTLTGAWIRPKLLFYPDKKFRFELGAQVLTYNGRDEYTVYPWFAAVYQPKKNITIRMGSLNSDHNHGLSEPVMDSEHYLISKPEAGIQAKYWNSWLKTDFWIDWQKMIFKGDPFKEHFTFGIVTEMNLVDAENIRLSLPLTFNGRHQGGEIDTNPDPVLTHIAVLSLIHI